MIGEAIADAVDKYITQDYVAATVAEWAKANFDVTLEPDDLHGKQRDRRPGGLHQGPGPRRSRDQHHRHARRIHGRRSRDTSTWDAKGLSSWAMSRFHVNLSQNQIRKMSTDELETSCAIAAIEQIDQRDCAGLMKYLEPHYAEQELANWATRKIRH